MGYKITSQKDKELEAQASLKLIDVTSMMLRCLMPLKSRGGDITIARIGHWLWIESETRKSSTDYPAATRGALAAAGFKWSNKRCAWSWAPYKWSGKQSRLGLDQLAVKHGYQLAN